MEVRFWPGPTTWMPLEAALGAAGRARAGAAAAWDGRDALLGPVDATLAGRDGAGRLWASTWPPGAAMALSLATGFGACDPENGLENGFSLKRVISVLQPAAAAASRATRATRADERARHSARKRML